MATVQTMSPSSDGQSLPKLSPLFLKSALDVVSAPEQGIKQDDDLLKPDERSVEKHNVGQSSSLQVKSKVGLRSKKRKRRHSFNEGNRGGKFRRNVSYNRKNGNTMLPNKFLLGGNIADPLNLNSMLDESVNEAMNAVTPSSSPLPPRSSVVDVIVPSNIRDPLGLNTESDVEPTSSTSVVAENNASKRRKRKRRNRSNSTKPNQSIDEEKISTSDDQKDTSSAPGSDVPSTPKAAKKRPAHVNIRSQTYRQQAKNDPIVSPVIPQDMRRRQSGVSPKIRRGHRSMNTVRALVTEIGISSVEKCRSESEKTQVPIVSKRRRTYSENMILSLAKPTDEEIDVIIKSCFNTKVFNFGKSKDDVKTSDKKDESKKDDLKMNPISQSPVKKQVNEPKQNLSGKNTKENDKSKQRGKSSKKPTFKPQDAKYQYGNYSQYYGYRNPTKFQDARISSFKKEWFKDKDVLDVGCNSGHLTLLIARDFNPRKIVGIDIDESLIHCARTNIRHYITSEKTSSSKFPMSMALSLGPIAAPPIETNSEHANSFPYNVNFFYGNYVPARDEVLKFQEPEYDVIMCLSVSKWIHLNFGDEGLKRMFQRVYKQLRPGGKFILEPQPWKSYSKKKTLTERIYSNYTTIKLLPPDFPTYLRDEVGFKRVEYLDTPVTGKKGGFERPIHVYYKPE